MSIYMTGGNDLHKDAPGTFPTQPFTILGAAKIVNLNAGAVRTLFNVYDASSGNGVQLAFLSDGTFKLVCVGGASGLFASAPSTTDWFWFAITCPGGGAGATIGYFRNQNSAALTSVTATAATYTPNQITIPYFHNLDAEMCCFRIWNAVLTSTEILTETRSQLPVRSANLYAAYRMALAASAGTDTSGNGFNLPNIGTITDGLTEPYFWIGSGIIADTASANLSTGVPIAAAAAAVATVTDALTTLIKNASSAQDVALASGSLLTTVKLSAAVSALASAAGTLVGGIQLAGAAIDVSANTGVLTSKIQLAATAQDVMSASASLLTALKLASGAADSVSASTAMTTKVLIATAAQNVATVAGNLSAAIRFAAVPADVVTAHGALTSGIRLADAAQAIETAHGSLVTAIRLMVAALDRATATGSLTTQPRFTAQARMLASAVASLKNDIEIAGGAHADAEGSGTLSPVAGYLVGGSDLGGYLRPLPSYPAPLRDPQ